MEALRQVGRAWRGFRWYLDGVTGESRYANYLAHEQSVHPDRTPLSQREFWASEYRGQESNPQSRCC